MKKVLYILSIMILAASCKAVMEPLRVQLDDTCWSFSTSDQTARVCFPDDRHVSILQLDFKTGYTQSLDGTYEMDGHSVRCTGNNWPNLIKFVRTFSHLKNNSTNKNLTPLSPKSYNSLEGSVWAVLVNENLRTAFLRNDGTCIEGSFINVTHEEGLPYGWEWKKADYTHSGSRVQAGSFNGVVYDSLMVVDTLAVMVASQAPKSTETSALTGTVWEYETSGLPGAIFFTSDVDFTRILVASKIMHQVSTGTYKLEGATVTMTLDGKNETCQLEGGRFTFFDKTYAKVNLP